MRVQCAHACTYQLIIVLSFFLTFHPHIQISYPENAYSRRFACSVEYPHLRDEAMAHKFQQTISLLDPLHHLRNQRRY